MFKFICAALGIVIILAGLVITGLSNGESVEVIVAQVVIAWAIMLAILALSLFLERPE